MLYVEWNEIFYKAIVKKNNNSYVIHIIINCFATVINSLIQNIGNN